MVSQELEPRIKKLEDIEEIKNLQAKYAYLIDTLKFGELSDLFVEDITSKFDPLGRFKNKTELITGLKALSGLCSMMCHQMMTPYIEVNGKEAKGVWYLFGPFTAKGAEGGIAHWIQGKYENEFVEVDGKWKFSKIGFQFKFRSPYEDGWVKTPMFEP